MLKNKAFAGCLVLLSIVCFFISCKKENYELNKDNATLATIKFSEGLKIEGEFDSQTTDYQMKIKSQTKKQSLLSGFFVICIPDHPASKSKVSISGKARVKEIDKEIPFNKELPIPFVPLKLRLKTSTLFPNLPNIPNVTKAVKTSVKSKNHLKSLELLDDSNNQGDPNGGEDAGDTNPVDPSNPIDPNNPNLPIDPNNPNLPIDPNDPNLPKLPFDPNDPNLPELPIDPKDPNFPDLSKILPDISKLPEYVLIELSDFDLKIVVTSPDMNEKTYTVHGKVEGGKSIANESDNKKDNNENEKSGENEQGGGDNNKVDENEQGKEGEKQEKTE